MTKTLQTVVDFLSPKKPSDVTAELGPSGGLRADIASYLETEEGKQKLLEAQDLWKREHSRTAP
jgi:hypothetical protein